MDRFLQGTPATVSCSFTSGDTVIDPGVVSVTITREDGTALVTDGATSGTGAAPRTSSLTTVQTAALDFLTLTWTSATLGTLTTYAEIRGGFLFSLAEARALKPLDNTTTYPTTDVIAARVLAECALEEACGVAFVPTYKREKIDGNGTTDVLLKARPLSVTSATVGGVEVADLSTLELYADGRLYNPSMWTAGRRNIEVKYTYGYPFPPPRVGRACLLLAKRFLVDSPISDRVTTMTTPEGGTQFYVTAGVRDAVFDVPEANAVVQRYGLETPIG